MENLSNTNMYVASHFTNVEVGAIVQTIKDIKSSIISLYADGTVIGSDNMAYIKITQLPIIGVELSHNSNTLRKFLSTCMCGVDIEIEVGNMGTVKYLKNIATSERLLLSKDSATFYDYDKHANIILEAYKRVLSDIAVSTVTGSADITKSAELQSLLNLSSKDGVHMFTFFNHTMSLFNGLLPINKSDKVSVTVYDNPVDKSCFITEFAIIKPKTIIKTLLRYVNIN